MFGSGSLRVLYRDLGVDTGAADKVLECPCCYGKNHSGSSHGPGVGGGGGGRREIRERGGRRVSSRGSGPRRRLRARVEPARTGAERRELRGEHAPSSRLMRKRLSCLVFSSIRQQSPRIGARLVMVLYHTKPVWQHHPGVGAGEKTGATGRRGSRHSTGRPPLSLPRASPLLRRRRGSRGFRRADRRHGR